MIEYIIRKVENFSYVHSPVQTSSQFSKHVKWVTFERMTSMVLLVYQDFLIDIKCVFFFTIIVFEVQY